jgi:putative sterol carrier protein
MFEGLLDIRAPMDITPARFFEQWLPAQIENLKALIEAFAAGIDFSVSVGVTGDGGGEWTAGLVDGSPSITPGLDPQALVTFIVSEENFIQSVTGQLDDLRMKPQDAAPDADLSPEAIKKQAQEMIAALKGLNGSLRASVDDPDRPLAVTVKFAGEMKDRPDCEIKVEMEDVKAIASGELDPQSAFMGGRFQIEDESGLLTEILALLL